VSDEYEDLFGDVDEENETQVGIAGEDTVYNDPNEIEIDDINSRGGPTLQDLKEKAEEEANNSGRREGPKPGEVFGFEVVEVDGAFSFSPEYYPDSWNSTKSTDTESQADSCKGENIDVNKVNNYRIHARGIFLMDRNLETFHSVTDHRGEKVEVINPLLPNEGIECIIKKAKFGEIKGWDPIHRDWQISYTLDFISTGKDDSSSTNGKNGIVDSGGIVSLDSELTGVDEENLE
jgi:hypothetical protein